MMSDEMVNVEMREGLVSELAAILRHEVDTAESFESTEQYMQEGAERLEEAITDTES